jgi:hypothetical protein
MELSNTHLRQGGLTMSFSIHGRFREQIAEIIRQADSLRELARATSIDVATLSSRP